MFKKIETYDTAKLFSSFTYSEAFVDSFSVENKDGNNTG